LEITKDILKTQISEATAGKQSAFKFLLDNYWNQVFGFLLKRVNDEHEAEEIAIETFSKAFDKVATYDENYEFATWLTSIAKNIQIDRFRKKKTSPLHSKVEASEELLKKITDGSLNAEDQLIKEQNLRELLGYIKMLKPHYQEVINLFYFQELSYQEISDTIGQPLSNVKVRLLRARKLLAEIITWAN